MRVYKVFLWVLALLWLGFGSGLAASETSPAVFDSEQFWAAHPADSGAQEAWRQGAKWPAGPRSFGVYHDGRIFGFVSRAVPTDPDAAVQARLAKTYADRAELEALQVAGLFSFDQFQCPALAGYPGITPRLELCAKVEVKSKMTSAWSGRAFSVVRLSADEICACRKALDQGQGEDNAGTFFGEIARQELRRLHQAGQSQAVRDFFGRHFKKKVFQAPELIMIAEAWTENQGFDEALILLNTVTDRFAPDLTSEQWEKCGDLYYLAGRENQAAQAYSKASETLYR